MNVYALSCVRIKFVDLDWHGKTCIRLRAWRLIPGTCDLVPRKNFGVQNDIQHAVDNLGTWNLVSGTTRGRFHFAI